jgi:hypothetical protein
MDMGDQMDERSVKAALDAWRDAVRRRDALAPGSADRPIAADDVRNASKAFHAELAQQSARYAEEASESRTSWSTRLDLRGAPAAEDAQDNQRVRSTSR